MKKIVFFSEESLFSGNVKCGIAEVVDSLALSLVGLYEVSVICKEGTQVLSKHIVDFEERGSGFSYAKLMGINYYIINNENWSQQGPELINELRPDILHNFCDLSLVSRLRHKPGKCIFTFDDLAYLEDKIPFLQDYDFFTTFSHGYWEYVTSLGKPVIEKIKDRFIKTRCGITDEIFNPATGLLLQEPYSINELGNKQTSRKLLKEDIAWWNEGPLFLTMGNISFIKGAESLLSAADIIDELGGQLVVFGSIQPQFQEAFAKLANKKKLFFREKVPPTHVLPILAGADFYLQPSLMESGGLLPMAASKYGAIPIVTQNGGFKDNFNSSNAIIIKEGISNAIKEAFDLYNNYLYFMEKQKVCMAQDFGWKTRKWDYIALYEAGETI